MRLKDLYAAMSTEQRESLSATAGLDAGYLYQIATRWRGKRPSIELMARLSAADQRLTLDEMVAEFAKSPAQPEPIRERRLSGPRRDADLRDEDQPCAAGAMRAA